MSQPELHDRLREQTPRAPEELRERVRLTAATAAPPRATVGRARRRVLLALALVTLVAAAIGAAVLERGGNPTSTPVVHGLVPGEAKVPGLLRASPPANGGVATGAAPAVASGAATVVPALPAPSPTRAQLYRSTLRLRVATGTDVSTAARRAVEIAQGLGGYPATIEVTATSATGTASLALAVPRPRVATAIARLAELGTVVEEHVSVSDLQSGIDATSRTIVRLERQLAAAEHAPPSAKTRALVAALTAQIEGLQRQRAASQRSASDATVTVVIATAAARRVPARHPARRGPFHDLGVAVRDVGIGAVYALALGVPLAVLAAAAWYLAVRLRRRREEQLLSRS